MRILILVFFAVFGAMCFSALKRAQTSTDDTDRPEFSRANIPDLLGKQAAELRLVFGDFDEPAPDGTVKVNRWGGWQSVFLGFSENKQLEYLSLEPKEPLSESEAKAIVQKLYEVALPPQYATRAPALLAYRNMPGKVATVNFPFINWRNKDYRIGRILVIAPTDYEAPSLE
jgi:hypothetical protein